MGFSNYLIAI